MKQIIQKIINKFKKKQHKCFCGTSDIYYNVGEGPITIIYKCDSESSALQLSIEPGHGINFAGFGLSRVRKDGNVER